MSLNSHMCWISVSVNSLLISLCVCVCVKCCLSWEFISAVNGLNIMSGSPDSVPELIAAWKNLLKNFPQTWILIRNAPSNTFQHKAKSTNTSMTPLFTWIHLAYDGTSPKAETRALLRSLIRFNSVLLAYLIPRFSFYSIQYIFFPSHLH